MILFINILAWVFLVLCILRILFGWIFQLGWDAEDNKLQRLLFEMKTGYKKSFTAGKRYFFTAIVSLCWIISRFFQP